MHVRFVGTFGLWIHFFQIARDRGCNSLVPILVRLLWGFLKSFFSVVCLRLILLDCWTCFLLFWIVWLNLNILLIRAIILWTFFLQSINWRLVWICLFRLFTLWNVFRVKQEVYLSLVIICLWLSLVALFFLTQIVIVLESAVRAFLRFLQQFD